MGNNIHVETNPPIRGDSSATQIQIRRLKQAHISASIRLDPTGIEGKDFHPSS
jgi:hypothetical protein